MNLKSVFPYFLYFPYFPVILCLTVCVFVVLPDYAFGGPSLTTATEDPNLLDSGIIETFLGEPSVPSIIAQPDLPMGLRPSGAPKVIPGRISKPRSFEEQPLLIGSYPEVIKEKEPDRPPVLLPQPEPDPGIVYVVPFTWVMVPDEVHDQIFDQFVDAMNRQSASLGLQFVILKQGAERVGPNWLAVRKYITGEIYSYIEDSGAHYTEMRTKARITYHHPNQRMPVFATVLPVSTFFDRNQSGINVERIKLAKRIATTLTERLLPAFDTSLISKHSPKAHNNGA